MICQYTWKGRERVYEVKYYQCTKCGAVTALEGKLELDSDIYAELHCDRCCNEKAMYLCDNINDIYIYADVCLDERYYYYGK